MIAGRSSSGSRRHEQRLEGSLRLGDRELEARDLLLRLGGHLGVIERQELARLRELLVHLLETRGLLDDQAQALMLSTEGTP
jgi:hypothetical protein